MSADSYSVKLGPVQLLWERGPDRWHHQLVSGENVILASEEGCTADLFPPSPAYQEMLIEHPGPGLCEFQLIGQSGKTIYSASVRVDTQARTVDFDCCARIKQADAATRSIASYRLAQGVSRSGGTDELTLDWKSAAIRLTAIPTGGAAVRLHDEGELWSAGWFHPAPVDSVRGSSFRWGYRIAVESGAGR